VAIGHRDVADQVRAHDFPREGRSFGKPVGCGALRCLRAAALVRELETGTRQAEALALYRRAGFVAIPAYGEYAKSPETSVCLEKAL
jgi:hypothetical protein